MKRECGQASDAHAWGKALEEKKKQIERAKAAAAAAAAAPLAQRTAASGKAAALDEDDDDDEEENSAQAATQPPRRPTAVASLTLGLSRQAVALTQAFSRLGMGKALRRPRLARATN